MRKKILYCLIVCAMAFPAPAQESVMTVERYETSAAGNKLTPVGPSAETAGAVPVTIHRQQRYQVITGFGGSFTEATAYLVNRMSAPQRARILAAYFGDEGARYSLTRTHINSCDFSRMNYAYANRPGDRQLEDFNIEPDRADLIPMIKAAMGHSREGFKIIASPWTAPPWMKDNNDWRGGKLLPEYRDTWALYFSKYLQAYRQEGIPVWGVTVENEPLGNDKNWESMHFTPEEMRDFVNDHLGPRLEKDGWGHVKILGYDQNRGEELEKWANVLYADSNAARYMDGMAMHWYASTYDFFPASLQHTHRLAPGKHLINTEACVDADVPHWQDDAWYWSKEATDWGWDWASEKEKHLHPKYVPVFRYAGDIIGCLNNHVDGWIDWNMVLDRQGGPNWFKNWCTAPVIVDTAKDEVYFTPLFYTLAHFSRFIRPGAVRVGVENPDPVLQVTAAENPDGSLAVVLFNPGEKEAAIRLQAGAKALPVQIPGKAIQTLVIQTRKPN